MQRRAFLIGSVLPLFARDQGNPQSASWESLISDLETQIPKPLEENLVPGLSISIVKNGKLVWRRGFGVKENVSKEPVDTDTIFEAASMSEPVFAYAVMKLCEKGVMDLDTPPTKYTSERVREGDPRLELITARHVLSHTSGFQNWRSEEKPIEDSFRARREVSLFRRGLQLFAIGRGALDASTYRTVHESEPF